MHKATCSNYYLIHKMSEIYMPCDTTGCDCDPDTVITQMQEERGKFSDDVSQQIQHCSNILRFAEKTKRQFPSGMGDYVKTMVLDIAQPSARDVIDHQKRLGSAKPNDSPCDIPCAKIPYGSHTVEACLFGWCWETDWFCKTDLAFKYKREKQIGQIKQIMTTWAAGIWDKWVWRSYQRSVQNYVLNANIPNQHGASGYPLEDPTSIITIPWLDVITTRLRDAAGLIGSPAMGAWCILIGEEECKTLFDYYFKDGAEHFGVRQAHTMENYKRYDQALLGGCEYYEISNYKFFTECHAPRYRDRVGGESWDDALLDDREQVISAYGTESRVPAGYRDPDIAKYSEILIFNEEAVRWLTPPVGMTENNGFNVDRHPGYSYSGDFIPVRCPEDKDPLGKKVKYHAEFVAGMESIFPKRGAAILALASHVQPEIETITYTLTPTEAPVDTVSVQASVPILPDGTLQIQTRDKLPNVADGQRLFLVTAGDKKVKIATVSSNFCEDLGVWLHALTFDNAQAGACVPRECDQWKFVSVFPEGTADSTLVDENGCALCTSSATTPICVSYVGDNIRGVKVGTTTTEGTVAATLESAVQTYLDGNEGGTVEITEGVAGNDYVWTICITGGTATSFSVFAEPDGGGLSEFSSDDETATVTNPAVFTVTTNGDVAGFADYAGDYYDSGENDGSGNPVWTNGTRFAANGNDAFGDAVMEYYPTLSDAQNDTNTAYESSAAGTGRDIVTSGTVSTEVGFQASA